DRRPDDACRTACVRTSAQGAADLPSDRRPDCRSAGAQSRHYRRLAGKCGPCGGLAGGRPRAESGAGAGRPDRPPARRCEGLLRRHYVDRAQARRGADGNPYPAAQARCALPVSQDPPSGGSRPETGASPVLALDPVFQDTDFLDFQFDGIAVFEKPAELKTAAIADSPGADEFARHQCLVLRDMRDDLLERKQHALAYTFRTDLAVDADFHPQVVWIADLVGSHDTGAHVVAAVKAIALR